MKIRHLARKSLVNGEFHNQRIQSRLHGDSLSSESGKLLVRFNPDESPTTFDRSNTGCSRTAEGVDDEIAGLAGAENDWTDEGQWELSGEIGEAFAAVFNETWDAPDVVPKFAVWVSS